MKKTDILLKNYYCKAFLTGKILRKKSKKGLENWDLERISLMDRLILITAITEIDNFPLTPAKVIINEYIEVSKVFATDRSQIFVNGILDKYTKDISRA